MDYDGILQKIGEFGKYQKLVFLCLCLATIPGAFNNLTIVFLAAVPNHSCANPSTSQLHLDEATLLNLTTPTEEKDGEIVYSKCKSYDRDYSNWTLDNVTDILSLEANDRTTSVKDCDHGWVYDTSTYTSTIVTEVFS